MSPIGQPERATPRAAASIVPIGPICPIRLTPETVHAGQCMRRGWNTRMSALSPLSGVSIGRSLGQVSKFHRWAVAPVA